MYKAILAYCKPADGGSWWGLGQNGALPWGKCAEDLRHFAHLTARNGPNAVIMGRKTFESLPRRLTGRQELVLSYTLELTPEQIAAGVKVFSSLAAIDAYCRQEIAAERLQHCWVIGGLDLYHMFLANAWLNEVYVTQMDAVLPCDTCLEPWALMAQFQVDPAYTYETWAMDVNCRLEFRRYVLQDPGHNEDEDEDE